MSTAPPPLSECLTRLSDRRATVAVLTAQDRRLGRLRLLAALLAVAAFGFSIGVTWISPWWIAPPLLAFAVLAVRHDAVLRQRERTRRAVAFYEGMQARLEDRWAGSGVTGEAFLEPHHLYAGDLDLFGRGSLFELLCQARTDRGQRRLADWLLHPAAPDTVLARQQAVRELAPLLDLREELALAATEAQQRIHLQPVLHWAAAPPVSFPGWAGPVMAVSSVLSIAAVAAWALEFAPRTVPLAVLALQSLLVWQLRPAKEAIVAAEHAGEDVLRLADLLALVERPPFASAALQELQHRLRTGGGTASLAVRRLGKLQERLEWGHNLFFRPIAALLLWEEQLALRIERWRQDCGRHVSEWVDGIGEFEAYASLGGYSHEHPADPFPAVLPAGPVVEGRQLGHPLLPPAKAVRNDVRLDHAAGLLVVSGSNMSGKSTYLRTVGLNVVLALAGAPVRAGELRVSPVAIGASIRVVDSLQEGHSRFFAEITRLRDVVRLTEGGLPVLFLLDEVLSGTNSHDRRIGAERVVEGLVGRGAIGLLTTHDLALTALGERIAGARNVHFADEFTGGQLHFDYQMRPGVVQRSNALELMRYVGLLS